LQYASTDEDNNNTPSHPNAKDIFDNKQLFLGRGTISVAELKILAKKFLPKDSTLRSIIISEPDFLPRNEIPMRVDMYVRLLDLELRQNAR
jgi:hypothetical protein